MLGIVDFMNLCNAIHSICPAATGGATFVNEWPVLQNGVLTSDVTVPVQWGLGRDVEGGAIWLQMVGYKFRAITIL